MKYETKKLKDCATIIAGQSPESKYYNNDGIGLPFFQGKTDFGELYPKIRVYCSQPTKTAEKNDILLSVRAPVGPTNLAPTTVCIGRGLSAIRPNESLVLKYLLYFFKYYELQLSTKGTGTTFKSITQAVIKDIDVPVPPLEEQQRIVTRIEEMFSELDNAVATLKETKQKLAVYRQAVLKEAFEGIDNASECKLGSLMKVVRNGYGKKPTDSGEYRLLRISSVRSTKLDLEDYRCNDLPFDSIDLIHENDLLFTRYNGSKEYVGVCAVVPKLNFEYAYPDKLIKFTPNLSDAYHSKYIQYFVSQGYARDYIRSKIKTTSGQNGISSTDLKNLTITIPNLIEQERIVKNIEVNLSSCDNIEKTIDTALQQSEALRQSILKKAFEGGL